MSPEWLSAVASFLTFFVIALSAGFALLQMRHMRGANQISLFTAYNSEFDTPEFQLAFAYVRSELPERLKEDRVLNELAAAPPFVGEYAAIRTIANFFEDMGAFVLTGLLDERTVCTLYSENVTSAWAAIAPVTALLRHKLNSPSIWENFEYLAFLGTRFIEINPNGTYPRTLPRMPLDDTLVNRWKTQKTGIYVG